MRWKAFTPGDFEKPPRWGECQNYRGKAPQALFTASTLGSSLMWKLDATVVREKEAAIRDAWHIPHTSRIQNFQASLFRDGLLTPSSHQEGEQMKVESFESWFRRRTLHSRSTVTALERQKSDLKRRLRTHSGAAEPEYGTHQIDAQCRKRQKSVARELKAKIVRVNEQLCDLDPIIPLASNSASFATSVRDGGSAAELHRRFACPNVHPVDHRRRGNQSGENITHVQWPLPNGEPGPVDDYADSLTGEMRKVYEMVQGMAAAFKQNLPLPGSVSYDLFGRQIEHTDITPSVLEALDQIVNEPEGLKAHIPLIKTTCNCLGHEGQEHFALSDQEMYRKSLEELAPTGLNLDQTKERYLQSELCKIETNAQVEFKGKVRVSSLHDAAVNNTARNLTRRLMKRLKAFPEIKTGRDTPQLTLETSHAHALLGCADISDATGNLSHELALHVLQVVGEGEFSEQEMRALTLLNGPQLDCFQGEEKITQKSTHMGIGCGWPVLCLILAYLADIAGAEPQEVAICGDDSAMLSSNKVRGDYMDLMHRCGLRINRIKSYDGRSHGVFCENMLTIDDSGQSAYLTEIMPIGQASMKRTRGSSTKEAVDQRAIAIALDEELKNRQVLPAIRALARRSIGRTTSAKRPGPCVLGGHGTGPVTETVLAGYILHGAVETSQRRGEKNSLQHLDETYLKGREERRGLSSVPIQEAKTLLMRQAEIEPRFSGDVRKTHVLTKDKYEKKLRTNAKCGQLALNGTNLSQLVKDSPFYSCKAKRRIYHLILQSHKKVSRRLTTAIVRGRKLDNIHVSMETYMNIEQATRPTQRIGGKVVCRQQ
jgi:hypothetical protein